MSVKIVPHKLPLIQEEKPFKLPAALKEGMHKEESDEKLRKAAQHDPYDLPIPFGPLHPKNELHAIWHLPSKTKRDYKRIEALLHSPCIEKTELLWNGRTEVPILHALISQPNVPLSVLESALSYDRSKVGRQNPVGLAVSANRADAVASFLKSCSKEVVYSKDTLTQKTPWEYVTRKTDPRIASYLFLYQKG